MNGWITAVVWMLVAACQIEAETAVEETATVEQAAITPDCLGPGNFAGKKLPALPLWNGSAPPVAQAGQIWLDVPDWRPNTQNTGQGFHVAVLVRPSTGSFLWGATVPDGKMSTFRVLGGNQPRVGDCCRPPPCGCRTCCDQFKVNAWAARNFLEVGLRAIDDAEHGAISAGPL